MDKRDEFEAWARNEYGAEAVVRQDDGYKFTGPDDAWRGYQAALSRSQDAFQARVHPWMLACFGAAIAADRQERNHRFFEEAAELVQSCGMTASEAHQLVDYTWSRPVGEKSQEVGGVMVTLAALCLANGLDMHAAGEMELERISAPETMAKIRAKQAAKPKHSPLPEARSQDVARVAKPVAWRYLTPTGWHATTHLDKALGASAHHEMQPLYAAPRPPQARAGDAQPLIDALEETQGLLVAMMHETRDRTEIGNQLDENRAALLAFRSIAPAAPAVAPQEDVVAWANRVSCNKYSEEMDAIREALGLAEDCDYGEIIEKIEALREVAAPAPAEPKGEQCNGPCGHVEHWSCPKPEQHDTCTCGLHELSAKCPYGYDEKAEQQDGYARSLPAGVSIKAFRAAYTNHWCIFITHPWGQTPVAVKHARDVNLAHLLSTAKPEQRAATLTIDDVIGALQPLRPAVNERRASWNEAIANIRALLSTRNGGSNE